MRTAAVKASTDRNQMASLNWLELEQHAALGCGRAGILQDEVAAAPDAESVPILRQADEARRLRRRSGRTLYLPRCDGDPLRDPAARKWADSPLKAPEK